MLTVTIRRREAHCETQSEGPVAAQKAHPSQCIAHNSLKSGTDTDAMVLVSFGRCHHLGVSLFLIFMHTDSLGCETCSLHQEHTANAWIALRIVSFDIGRRRPTVPSARDDGDAVAVEAYLELVRTYVVLQVTLPGST
jgi:hypothetical protein